MNKKYFGIIQNHLGCYVAATLIQDDGGEFLKPQFSIYESLDLKDEYRWGRAGIIYGVPIKYKSNDSKLVYEHYNSADNDEINVLSAFANNPDITFGKELFDSNLVKITSEDAFLTTIPLYYSDYKEESFISIYFSENFSLVAITYDNEQKVVFRFNSDNVEDLPGFIGRIERYWTLKYNDMKFPSMVIFLNRNDNPSLLQLKPHLIKNDLLQNLNIDQFRALGLALGQLGNNCPVFSEETERAKFRNKRFIMNITSVSIVLLTVFILLLLFLAGKYNDYKLDKLKNEYTKIIASDAEVKELKDRNRELAGTILYMESNISKRTRWAEFLYTLGKGVPKGLFVEKLGSDPVKGSDNQIKIALLGYASQEISITQFISLLQKTSYITKVSLVSMEKDKKRRDKYRFKVICTLLSDK